MRGSQIQLQFGGPFTPMVKRLIIINMVSWIGLVLILQNWILETPLIFKWFGLTPDSVLLSFSVWQPLTYMFVHSPNVFHVIFNMLVLWMFGGELEQRWGGRFFLGYYLGCGVGAGLLYIAGALAHTLITGDPLSLKAPVVGASGAVFGLMLAYGILFGERVIHFMMLFPMKAKVFVMIIGGIEVLNLMSQGMGSQTANLAHLGGLVSGFILLRGWAYYQSSMRKVRQKRGRNLRLVVNNRDEDKDNPRYWN